MKVYIVVEITKPNQRPRIISVFDNPEEAMKCRDYCGKGIHKDDPYEIIVYEFELYSEFKKCR